MAETRAIVLPNLKPGCDQPTDTKTTHPDRWSLAQIPQSSLSILCGSAVTEAVQLRVNLLRAKPLALATRQHQRFLAVFNLQRLSWLQM